MTRCEACGWEGVPEVPSCCKSCGGPLYCPLGCEGGHDHAGAVGRHYRHIGPCAWHDGPCAAPKWCPCPGIGATPTPEAVREACAKVADAHAAMMEPRVQEFVSARDAGLLVYAGRVGEQRGALAVAAAIRALDLDALSGEGRDGKTTLGTSGYVILNKRPPAPADDRREP